MKTYSHDYSKPSEVDSTRVIEFSFVVKKRPKREVVVTHYKNGSKKIVLQITQEEMNDLITGKAKEK